MLQAEKIYCSLDIETTGFDPLKDEILEIGLAFFILDEKGIKITEEYSKAFKPAKPAPEIILGLTGISKQELEEAESFAKAREAVQDKLKDVCVVGHNIGFDIKFLEGFGIKFLGQSIDTLDLAQFILPTHHSYNLENLMHYFGVPHTEAHRALADAKATLKVLQGLIGIYGGFPANLKQEIKGLIKPFNLPWASFLDLDLKPKSRKTSPANRQSKVFLDIEEFNAHTFYNFPLGQNFTARIAEILKNGKTKSLLVVPKKQEVLDIWQQGLAEAVFDSRQLFNEEKFLAFKASKDLTLDELKFALKIMVWQKTNWQSEALGDLNLSFFGGQFKAAVFGKETREKLSPHLICDYQTYLSSIEEKKYKSRKTVFVGLPEMEKAVSENIADKLSWGYANYLFKNFYDPETGAGVHALKALVEAGLSASDLFFGLVNAFYQSDPPGFSQIPFKFLEEDQNKFTKIKAAAENYANKLKEFGEKLNSKEIESFGLRLGQFFEPEENRVKWLEISRMSCVFYSSPLEIVSLTKKLFDPTKQAILCDCLPKDRVVEYFVKRLGLQAFKIKQVGESTKRDLFSFKKTSPRLEVFEKDLDKRDMLNLLEPGNLPAAVLFDSPSQAREFYEANHRELKKRAFVLAQLGSGSGRVLKNFSIHEDSLLIATDKLVLKFMTSDAIVPRLSVKTLVLGRVPFEHYKHPYWEAVAAEFTEPFVEFAIPRALLNLHLLLRFFYSEALETVQVWDSKLKKAYAVPFLSYLKGFR